MDQRLLFQMGVGECFIKPNLRFGEFSKMRVNIPQFSRGKSLRYVRSRSPSLDIQKSAKCFRRCLIIADERVRFPQVQKDTVVWKSIRPEVQRCDRNRAFPGPLAL
jgi:hypothetical protein